MFIGVGLIMKVSNTQPSDKRSNKKKEKKFIYHCFRCDDRFELDRELDTDKPTCDKCFAMLKENTTLNGYLNFLKERI